MFTNCNKLTSLDISNFDTQNVTNMGGMFMFCSGLTSLDLSNFDTKNVTGMTFMFYECSGLTSLDLSNFDTQNVTKMGIMFYECSGLTSLNVGNFDTKNVTDMGGMFQNCSGLTSLDISNFDTQNVTNMNSMFSGCNGLAILDLSNFDMTNVTSSSNMLRDCSALKSLYISASMENIASNACEGVGTETNPCYINVPDGFNFGVDTSGDYFVWKGGNFTLGKQEEGIEVNEENFPDGNFRSFILSQWYGEDGWLYQREIKGITSMDVSNQGVADLTGIKYFTELKKLNVSDNQLVSLDLSINAKIDTLNCDNNQLASLDLSANTALAKLRCAGNQLMCITLAEGCDPGTYYEGENIVVIGSGASHEQYLEKPVKMLASGKYGIKVPSDFDFARLSQFVVDGETYYRGGYSDFPITMNSDRYIVFPSADDPSRISYTYAFPSEPSYLYPYKDNRLVVYVNVTEITDKPVALLGDVNNDGVVSISDAVCIISWLQENTLPVFIEGAADYNKDGSITVSDAIAIIQALLNEEVSPVIPDIPDDDISHLYPTASAKGIDVELLNAPQYTAFTMDVTLPNDMSIEDITLDETRAPHHQLASKRLANGKYRVIAYSPTLEGFNGKDGTLLTIKTNGKSMGMVNIDNIHFVDMNAQEHALHNANGNVTGINQAEAGTNVYAEGKTIVVDADQDELLKVYTATGLLYKTLDVKAGHNRFGDNATGIYIVNGKKINIR